MNSLVRWLFFASLFGVLFFVAAGLFWHLAYGIADRPPADLTLAGLHAQATIVWQDDGVVTIRTEHDEDALTGLGYVHGWNRGWSLVLWRQTALGRLGEWFGASAVDLDALTRRLSIAPLARSTYMTLAPAERERLRAYTDGVNAALLSQTGRLRPELVQLGLEPEAWEPWHTLAIERLFAWLTTTPLAPTHPAASVPSVAALARSDLSLRHGLQLFGFENSVAWAVRDSLGTLLFQRIVHGATALPFLQEVDLRVSGRAPLVGATLPGTPFFVTGKTAEHAWILFPNGDATIERMALDVTTAPPFHERIVLRDGTEHLLSFLRIDTSLPLDAPAPGGVDTVWALRWPGLQPGTDLSSWLALQNGESPAFTLLRGDGLRVDTAGAWTVLGAPAIRQTFTEGIFVGSTRWSAYAAELLEAQDTRPIPVRTWIDDAYSIWAAHYAPAITALVEPSPASTPAFRDAMTYLYNWDYAYDRPSIAASIFDTWMTYYLKDDRKAPVVFDASDSLRASAPRLQRTLEDAVHYLEATYGPDLRQWRWERVQPDSLFFPAWSLVSSPSESPPRRYAPLVFPGHGHPTSLAWGPAPVQGTLAAPAVWEAWVRTDAWEHVVLRRRSVAPHAPLGRYLASDRTPTPFVFPRDTEPLHTTSLTPMLLPR